MAQNDSIVKQIERINHANKYAVMSYLPRKQVTSSSRRLFSPSGTVSW